MRPQQDGGDTMVTDDERREVAERLRRAWANVPDKNPVRHHMRVLYEIYAAVGLNDDGADAIDLFDRLADLIEPSCDRDALLAVAETLEDCAGRDSDLTTLGYSCLAKRIREACGEVDG